MTRLRLHSTQPLALLATVLLTIGVAPNGAAALTISQTLGFPQILGFTIFSEATYAADGWTSVPYPFSQASQITTVAFTFDTTDPDFNGGVGPTGGDPGVAIGIVPAGQPSVWSPLVSVVPGNQGVLFFPSDQDPLDRFELLASELADGELVVSLGAFEGFATFSRPFTLDQSSSLTITVTGIPEPSTALLLAAGLAGLALAGRRRRS